MWVTSRVFDSGHEPVWIFDIVAEQQGCVSAIDWAADRLASDGWFGQSRHDHCWVSKVYLHDLGLHFRGCVVRQNVCLRCAKEFQARQVLQMQVCSQKSLPTKPGNASDWREWGLVRSFKTRKWVRLIQHHFEQEIRVGGTCIHFIVDFTREPDRGLLVHRHPFHKTSCRRKVTCLARCLLWDRAVRQQSLRVWSKPVSGCLLGQQQVHFYRQFERENKVNSAASLKDKGTN